MSDDTSLKAYFATIGDMAGLVLDDLDATESAVPLVLAPMVERGDTAELVASLHAALTVAGAVVRAEVREGAEAGKTAPGPALRALVAFARNAGAAAD